MRAPALRWPEGRLDLHLNGHAAIEAFRADSAIDVAEATLPHWLRPDG